jgi:hypothetical protein
MVTGKLLAAKQQKNMCGNKTLPSMEHDLNWGGDLCSEIEKMIGMQSEQRQKVEIYDPSQVMFSFAITFHYEPLLRITLRQLLWRDNVMFSGDALEVVRVEEPGQRQEWKLTLRIREPNGGVVTKVKKMLLLMNFEEESTSPTYLDGWTDIQSVWKQKGLLDL